jgi:hypothetical protein
LFRKEVRACNPVASGRLWHAQTLTLLDAPSPRASHRSSLIAHCPSLTRALRSLSALPPKVLTPYKANMYRLLIVVGFIGIVLGACGLAVLIDVENKRYWYSHTRFAEMWMMLTEKNAMTTNICLNGGIMAIIISFLRLQAHGAAKAMVKSGKKSS